LTPRPGHEVRSLSDQWRLPRFRRLRHCCTQRPRFRGFVPLPVGVAAPGFLRCNGALALLGLSSLGRSPSLPLGFSGGLTLPHRRTQVPRGPPQSLSASGHGSRRLPLLSGTSRTHPNWVLLPVLQSFKELGNWLTSSEVAGPFKVPVLVPNRSSGVGHPAASLCPQ
jgi:hypothetical protein